MANVGSRTRSEDQFLYAKVQLNLVPFPHFQQVPPPYFCSGDGTSATATLTEKRAMKNEDEKAL